jgi:Ser/Thr protein kinase RdoA (MazF antagonist)
VTIRSETDGPDGGPEIRLALESYPGLEHAHVTLIDRGLIHRTFRVEAGSLRYVLQQLNPILSPLVHENIRAVSERLRERKVPTPLLCRTRTGELFADLGTAGRWRLMTHVDGVAFDTCDSVAHARTAGTLVGRFHSALRDLDHEFHPLGFPLHEPKRHLADLERALVENRAHRMHPEVALIATAIRSAAAEWQSDPLEDLPDRVVHLDLKFNNVLFEVDGEGDPRAVSLIDLDTLSRRPLWIELGDAWRSWCNRNPEHEPEARLDRSIFEASAEGWLGALEIRLSRPELVSLAHGIERISIELCARFAADVLEERYFGWDDELFESASEHNLCRAKGQLSLYRQARETRSERLRFLLG